MAELGVEAVEPLERLLPVGDGAMPGRQHLRPSPLKPATERDLWG